MPDIGFASMPVIPTFKGLQGDLERGSSKALTAAGTRGGDKFGRSAAGAAKSRFAGAAKSIVAPLVGAFAAVKVGNFLKDSVAEARESQKVGALTTSTIKATGKAAGVTAKQVGDLSSAISTKTGIDDEAIQRGANMILTFKGVRNTVGKGNRIFDRATQSVTDMAAAMAGGSGGEIDLKSASIQIGKALNDPVKGMTALSKVGVTFTAKQKAVNKALVEGGVLNALAAKGMTTTATQFAKVQKDNKFTYQQTVDFLTGPMNKAQTAYFNHLQEGGHTVEAQKNILKELNSEFAGAAAAQTTSGEKFAVAFGNIKESVGTALLPAVDSIENAFIKKGVPAIQEFVTWAQDKAIPALSKFGRKATPVVRDVLGKAKDFLKEAQPYAEGFVEAFNKLPKGVKTGAAAAALLGFGATKLPGANKTGSLAKSVLSLALPKKPIPVFVVNKGGLPDGGKPVGSPNSGGGKLGWATKFLTNPLTLALGPAAAAAVGAAAVDKFTVGPGKAFSRQDISNIAGANAGSAGGGQMSSPFKPSDFDDGKPKRLAEALNKASFYSNLTRQNINKLPSDLARGMNGAEALKSQVFGIESSTKRSRAAVVSLIDALEAARQRAVKVEQAVSVARQSKVDRQLGGGMYVANMNVHGTSLPEVRRDADHQRRARAHGAESFR